ncbi:unnamed protein product [Boreogadus saida]
MTIRPLTPSTSRDRSLAPTRGDKSSGADSTYKGTLKRVEVLLTSQWKVHSGLSGRPSPDGLQGSPLSLSLILLAGRALEVENEGVLSGVLGGGHTLHDPLPGHILALLDQQGDRRGRIEIEERDSIQKESWRD